MATKKFWLLEWLDDHDAKTLSDVETLLSNEATVDEIGDFARARSGASQFSPARQGFPNGMSGSTVYDWLKRGIHPRSLPQF